MDTCDVWCTVEQALFCDAAAVPESTVM
jgi:hypothetical protein